MITVNKDTFLRILKTKPQWLIGKQIIYDGYPQLINDVSISGDNILIDKGNLGKYWVTADSVENPVAIDTASLDMENVKLFSVLTITQRIECLENHVGQPDRWTVKPLFEIVAALNKEILDLKLKINEIESKENKHEP